ncbi:hypothetical protein HK099_002666 [Clydaea vesicula]|uniref:Uncharacterized protein n=1 Tax=Clydaea vesicula TaxID=447962 RepID=A0AAD5Y1K7_9FUNG|nr:hypothetical protein HK099_002666 [Clydaea vesicula]
MIKKILLIRNGNNIFNKGFTKTLRPFATKVDPAVLSSEFDHIANKLSKFVDEKDLKTYKSLSIGEKLKKFDTILYNLTEKLNAYKAQLLDSKDSLQVFEKNVFFDCKRLNFIFRSEDLKELDSSFTDLIQLLDEYFKKIGMFSIFWKGGNIVDDIKFRLNHQDLLEPRNSMYYATGRFNERKFLIFEKTIKKLESLNLIKSKVDNSEVEDSLANFDPAALDNLNPKLFKFDINHSEEEKENANLDLNLDMLKKDIDNLVWQTILLQSNLVLTYDKEFDRLLRKPLIRVLEIGESEISKEFNLNEKYIEVF